MPSWLQGHFIDLHRKEVSLRGRFGLPLTVFPLPWSRASTSLHLFTYLRLHLSFCLPQRYTCLALVKYSRCKVWQTRCKWCGYMIPTTVCKSSYTQLCLLSISNHRFLPRLQVCRLRQLSLRLVRRLLFQHVHVVVELMVPDPKDDGLDKEGNGWTSPNPLHDTNEISKRFSHLTFSTFFSDQLTIKCGSTMAGMRISPRALDRAVVNKNRDMTTDLR